MDIKVTHRVKVTVTHQTISSLAFLIFTNMSKPAGALFQTNEIIPGLYLGRQVNNNNSFRRRTYIVLVNILLNNEKNLTSMVLHMFSKYCQMKNHLSLRLVL
jgi:hypothetical protein